MCYVFTVRHLLDYKYYKAFNISKNWDTYSNIFILDDFLLNKYISINNKAPFVLYFTASLIHSLSAN